MKSLRCSSLDRAAACPASADEPEIPTNPSTPEAELGTAVHSALASIVSGQEQDDPDLTNVDSDDLRFLTMLGSRCWEQLKRFFPDPRVEVELQGIEGDLTLTGHADVLSVVDAPTDGLGNVRCLDWKTGRAEPVAADQLRGYAFLALLLFPEHDTASVCLVEVRDSVCEWTHYARRELEAWWAALRESIIAERKPFNPGRACGFCPRGLTCPAKREMLAVAVDAIVGQLRDSDTPEDIVLLHERVKQVEALCEATRDAIKAHVQSVGGILPIGNGRELAIERQERRSIDLAAGSTILADMLPWSEVEKAMKVSKTDIEKIARAQAPRGQKQAYADELMDRLDDAGALKVTTIERLELRRAAVPQLETSNAGSGNASENQTSPAEANAR